jgi:NADH dehydrogenase
LAHALVKHYPELSVDDLAFHLVEATGRILPEVTDKPGQWVVRMLERRGAHVHLNTTVESAEDGHVVLSDGTEFESELMVWTAGNAATQLLRSRSDLPHTPRGLVQVRADLRIGSDDEIVRDAWAAGDDAAIPDLASSTPGKFTVPNAQNAVRQGKRLAKNLVRALRGREPKNYVHHSFGAIATLGLGKGIFQYRGIVIKGLPAWLMHRGYHVLAIPTWERKVRVFSIWLVALFYGRDIVSLASVQRPRDAFRDEAKANSLSSTPRSASERDESMHSEGQLLGELAAEVEADLELIANSRPADAESETPDHWLVDPEEVQLEETDLRSLQGAVESLQDDPRNNPGDASPR